MSMRLTVLGCGGSGGVPLVTGFWGNCDPANPRNRRTRTSLAMELANGNVWLIDAGPDLRAQLLREGIKRIEGVFLTHAHADHIMGLDELRAMRFGRTDPLPLYCDAVTKKHVLRVFAHCVEGGEQFSPLYTPFLYTKLFPAPVFEWQDRKVHIFEQDHGPKTTSLGFRFGNWAYSTDVKRLSEDAFAILKGVETWFVDCAVLEEKPTHAHLDLTLSWIRRVAPKRAILIHMGPQVDYTAVSARLPLGVELAYDGMQLNVG